MKIASIKAMHDIVKKTGYSPALQEIVLKDGRLYATDSYIAIIVETPETRELATAEETAQALDTDALLRFKTSEFVAIGDYLKEYENRFPNLEQVWKIAESKKGLETEWQTGVNPEHIIKVMKVFQSFGKSPSIAPGVWASDGMFCFEFQNEDIHIRAISMLVRKVGKNG